MQSKCTTNIEINKVRIGFTNKKMTAYGGFSLLAAFFEKINLRGILQEAIPIRESSPNGMGIYSKVLVMSALRERVWQLCKINYSSIHINMDTTVETI